MIAYPDAKHNSKLQPSATQIPPGDAGRVVTDLLRGAAGHDPPAGISVGTLVSLGSALALALALDLTQEQYATLLPKSVTTAISMDVAAELGGIAALTGAIVIVTGIVGALLAETVCKLFHITDPIAKGVGIGTAAHAVGTSKALQMGDVEGAMSGLSIAVAGVLTAVLCPVFVGFVH